MGSDTIYLLVTIAMNLNVLEGNSRLIYFCIKLRYFDWQYASRGPSSLCNSRASCLIGSHFACHTFTRFVYTFTKLDDRRLSTSCVLLVYLVSFVHARKINERLTLKVDRTGFKQIRCVIALDEQRQSLDAEYSVMPHLMHATRLQLPQGRIPRHRHRHPREYPRRHVRHARFPDVIPVASWTTHRHSRDDLREDVGEDVGVGVVECGLCATQVETHSCTNYWSYTGATVCNREVYRRYAVTGDGC